MDSELKELIFSGDLQNIEKAFDLAKNEYRIDIVNWFLEQVYDVLTYLDEDLYSTINDPKSVYRFLTISYLTLDGNKNHYVSTLKELPKGLLIFKDLIDLKIKHSDVHIFPKWLCNFSQLMNLSFIDCKIKEIPSFIGKMKSLEGLAFDCPILTYPNELFQLPNLHTLYITTSWSKIEGFMITKQFLGLQNEALSFLTNSYFYVHEEVVESDVLSYLTDTEKAIIFKGDEKEFIISEINKMKGAFKHH